MNSFSLESRLNDTKTTRFWQEWFGNSLHFPLVNILLETLLSDPLYYLFSPGFFSLLGASMLQAWALSRWQELENPRRLLGNLIGPATFTAIGLSLAGTDFLEAPNHIAYWVFALLLGSIQSLRSTIAQWLHAALVILEAILRGAMVAVMYYILQSRLDPIQTMSIPDFLLDPGHLFIVLAALLLGLNAGFSDLSARRNLRLARENAQKLKTVAGWLFGRDAQGRVIENPNLLQPNRQERTILLMEIRGFSRWSEARQPGEAINLLNRFYQTAEVTLNQHHAVKFKFSADEVRAIFPRVDDGLQAALKLRPQINALLQRHGLGVGIGLHVGLVVEGLLGGKDVKAADVIGDAVNIARQIAANAGPGELLVSETMRIAIGTTFRAGPKRQLATKDRDELIVVYPLE